MEVSDIDPNCRPVQQRDAAGVRSWGDSPSFVNPLIGGHDSSR